VVVVPYTTGSRDAAAVQRAAESVTLAIPASAGTTVSVAETRTRFETTGSSAAPTVTSAELDQWTTYSRAAVRALADQDYPAAREALQQAQAISDRAAAEMSREESRARQVLDTCLFGVRAFIEQQDPHAEDQMLACRRLVPRIAPSPHIHTPEVVEVLARIDRRIEGAHRGPLVVESQPSGCTVRLNGVSLGQTPFTSEQLAPGEYRVQVECGEGGHARVHRVTLADAVGPVTLRVDARFDTAVSTDGVLSLAYADEADASAHRASDAEAIGHVLGAAEVWVVGVGTDGALSGARVRTEDGAVIASSAPIAGGSATALVTALEAGGAAAPVASGGGGGGDVEPASWGMLWGGGAIAIAGAIMLAVGVPDLGAVGSPHAGESLAASQARQANGELLVGIGAALLGVGVIVAGVGTGLAINDTSRPRSPTTPSARLRLGPLGADLTLTF
jgi:hypothetical protein